MDGVQPIETCHVFLCSTNEYMIILGEFKLVLKANVFARLLPCIVCMQGGCYIGCDVDLGQLTKAQQNVEHTSRARNIQLLSADVTGQRST